MNYWQVDVKLTMEHESGKIQKITEKYLVDAVSPTDAEAKVFKDFEGRTPKLKMYYLYSYPAFTITFKSEEDMVKAEEDGSLSQFSDAIQEICERPVADSTYQFDAKRAISVTYEGRVITYS